MFHSHGLMLRKVVLQVFRVIAIGLLHDYKRNLMGQSC